MEKSGIKKRLIFYFYAFEGYKDNYANKLHLCCLKHYASVFNEALFVISVDDVDNAVLIQDVETELIKCGFKDIRFKIHKNNSYCEAQTFFEEITQKLDELDGLTFFGHNKGITNVQKTDVVLESIEAWILGMYFLNLEFINEVEHYLCYDTPRFYGAFLSDERGVKPLNIFYYVGTFYWLNCPKIANDIVTKYIEPIKTCYHRGFAESYPGIQYINHDIEVVSSHEWLLFSNGAMDSYKKMYEYLSYCLGHDADKYKVFYNEIKSNT